MFSRLDIGAKIFAAFGVVLALVASLAFVSYSSADRLVGVIENFSNRKLPGTSALWLIRQAETAVRADCGVLANPLASGAQRADGEKRLAAALERLDKGAKAYEALPHGTKTAVLWEEYKPIADRWLRDVATFRDTVRERDQAGASAARQAELDGKVMQDYAGVFASEIPVAEALKKSIAQTGEDAADLAIEAEHTERTVVVTLAVSSVTIAILLLLLGLVLSGSIGAVIKALLVETEKLAGAVLAGRLETRADTQSVHVQFRGLVEGMNKTMDAFGKPIRMASENMELISRGDIPEQVKDTYEGDFDQIKQSVNRCIGAVAAVVEDGKALAGAAVEGKLSARADASRHQGDFRKIVEGFNGTLDAVMKPIDEATQALQRLAQRDLRARVKGSYQGDHAKITEALNATAEALHDAMAQVAQGVDQVSSASAQIASSSQSVASGASEQASSLEETGSSLESMSSMTKQAADSAQEASVLATAAKGAATEGSAAMEQMTGAMVKIKASAEGTSQIIKEINEIAFQTNLLALNAAVEAARAGEAGRGFAVVAEEVRSLALRSKEAANKTEELIRQSVREAGEGEVTAKHVNGKLSEIVASVSKVTDIVAEISAAAKEQAAGIEQVSKAMGQMNTVTQQNAASSEESSSAAAELSGQSEELAAMVGLFQLDGLAVTGKPAAMFSARGHPRRSGARPAGVAPELASGSA